MTYLSYLNYVYPVIGIGSLVGIFLMSFRTGRKEKTESKQQDAMDTQQRTIDAQNTQIDLLRNRLVDVEKENTKLHLLLDTVISALKTEGKLITIDGNMVTIADTGDRPTASRPRTTKVTKAIQAVTTTQESETQP